MDKKNNTSKITSLKGIGEKTSKLFEKIGITTTNQLLSYYPRDYECFSPIQPISNAPKNEIVAIKGMLAGAITTKRIRNLLISTVTVRDESDMLTLTFFNMPYLKNILPTKEWIVFRGVLLEKNQKKVIEQPKTYKLEEYQTFINQLLPKYPLTKGLSNNLIAKAIKQAFLNSTDTSDYLPAYIRNTISLLNRSEAVETIHFPTNMETLQVARRRLVFDEFFLFLLQVKQLKAVAKESISENPMLETKESEELLKKLPYQLTNAQQHVWNEIKADLSGNKTMNRLVQGDVGSGKTILAFLALLMTSANGYQGALMAPTEVLAKQHFDTLCEMTQKYGLPFRPVLLVGSLKAKEKRDIYERIEKGDSNIVIGTHALIQEKVIYHKLALVVTDEQHRFGVRQRESLAGKGEKVHVLVMSATPIPRTLAIILYGDLDISVVDELPANRLPIKNCVVNTAYRPKAYDFIQKEVKDGHQVYVICPMVEEGELENVENVIDYTQKLKDILPSFVRIESLHGKMKPAVKNKIMEDFSIGNTDILVSTTVIEVGINVPNATVILIENAERFGLAQLHQLRGRIGRGNAQSFCIFISGKDSKDALERLAILNRSNDGFFIAQEDLKLRGPGDLFGIRQSGDMEFKIADIYNDSKILQEAAIMAEKVLREDPTLALTKHESIRQYLETNPIWVDFPSI